MFRFLSSLFMTASFVSFAFAEWEPVLEFSTQTPVVPMSLKPTQSGEAMADVIASILNHQNSRWDNGLHKLSTKERPFLVKGPDDRLFCITHYLAGQTGSLSDRRRSFDLNLLRKPEEIPLTVVGMRTDDFLQEVRRSKALPPTFRTIIPSKCSNVNSIDRSIEDAQDPRSFKLLTIPFESVRRHSTGGRDYPSASMVRLPDPTNRYSHICEAVINQPLTG